MEVLGFVVPGVLTAAWVVAAVVVGARSHR